MFRGKLLLKVILLGDSGVGKSSLMNRYVNENFSNQYKATIGTDFLIKETTYNDVAVTLQIWDTAGQERFQSLGLAFYRGADCCILVYDVTSPPSFMSIESWKDEFTLQTSSCRTKNTPFILIGNKCDQSDHSVMKKRAENWCSANEIPYYECSAKDGTRVEEAFNEIVKLAVSQQINNRLTSQPFVDSVKISNEDSDKEKCNC